MPRNKRFNKMSKAFINAAVSNRSQVKIEELSSTSTSSPSGTSSTASRLSSNSTSEPSRPSSSSFSKISSNCYDYYEDNRCEFDVVNVQDLSSMMRNLNLACPNCSEPIACSVSKRVGIASTVSIVCDACGVLASTRNSEKLPYKVEDQEKELETLNIRLVCAMRGIGRGYAGARLFCGMMNLPPPPSKWFSYQKPIATATIKVGHESMFSAVEEAVDIADSKDLAISLDGTWQKRGHTSLNGVVSAASVDTGKIVDLAVYSKYCKCPGRLKNRHSDASCLANYAGTSGGMEAAGAAEIFSNSLPKYGVRYSHYLGDGDSKGFLKVLQEKPYGDNLIPQKLECVNHVEKRVGTRIRKLKASGAKGEDNQSLNGRNRLPDWKVNKIQEYFGHVIRSNAGDANKLRAAIWSMFYHIRSSDENPSHLTCGEDWCKFKKAQKQGIPYEHQKHFHIPSPIMEALRPIFREMTQPQLLEKCVHGKTQNCNESFNNVIWKHLPKGTFVALETLSSGTFSAVSGFNDGLIGKCHLLKKLGIEPGRFCVDALRNEDKLRICKANSKFELNTREARRKRKRDLLRLEEEFEEEEGGPAYAAGEF